MKRKIQKIAYFSFLIVLIAFYGCENQSAQLEALTNENVKLSEDYQNLLLENRKITQTSDSVKTLINSLQGQVDKMTGEMPAFKASNQDIEAIEAMVNSLHNGWTTMAKTKDKNELLKYFLPQYTTSAVRINLENKPSVKRKSDVDFEAQLDELILENDLSITFGDTKFLYIEVKDKFFVTSYKTVIRVYQNNKQLYTSSLISQLAGENKEGWKVGSYTWVNFNYN